MVFPNSVWREGKVLSNLANYHGRVLYSGTLLSQSLSPSFVIRAVLCTVSRFFPFRCLQTHLRMKRGVESDVRQLGKQERDKKCSDSGRGTIQDDTFGICSAVSPLSVSRDG